MPMSQCERCGRGPEVVDGVLEYFDYCAHCSKNKCPGCAAEGCCGFVPMESGTDADEEANEAKLLEHAKRLYDKK